MNTYQNQRSHAAPAQPVCTPVSTIELSPTQCQQIGGGVVPAGRAAVALFRSVKPLDAPIMVPMDPSLPSPY